MGKAQSERMLERAKAENKMYNLLTPEQKKQYNENYQKREQKMMDHMNKMKAQMSSDQ
ncbi:Spy/CpxP family protein refolding chaperone [Acinetobacter baumannii]|uniref:Spy/CpxP family protein refolding chaperone n=1 Tax=Acinetobacter baumannii TaxID=470 RepID=UPI0040391017